MEEVTLCGTFLKRVRQRSIVGQAGDPHLREQGDSLQLDREQMEFSFQKGAFDNKTFVFFIDNRCFSY